ncbi:MAG: PqqD family peptide modification chaperone, partial [Clostridia bacterium]|nr:PqqD family peptide modification chaperone [Clostridia bacterium]
MVHLFCNNGYYIAVDPASGSVHSLDEVAYDVISLFEEKTEGEIVAELLGKYGGRPDVTEDEIRECIADVEELKAAGTLFSEDE